MSMKNSTGNNRSPLRHDLTIVPVRLDALSPLGRETRTHSRSQIAKLARSLAEFGFVLPIVIDDEKRIVAGAALAKGKHGLVVT